MEYTYLKTFSTRYPKGPYSANPQDETSIVFRNSRGYMDKITCPANMRDDLIKLLNSAESLGKIAEAKQKPPKNKEE